MNAALLMSGGRRSAFLPMPWNPQRTDVAIAAHSESSGGVAALLGLDEEAVAEAVRWARRRCAELLRSIDDRELLALLDPPGTRATQEVRVVRATLELRAIEPEPDDEQLVELIELDEVELPALEWDLMDVAVEVGPGKAEPEPDANSRLGARFESPYPATPIEPEGIVTDPEPEPEPEPHEIADTIAWLGRRMPIRPEPRPPQVDEAEGPARIVLQTWAQLVTLYTRDISCGGMYVETTNLPQRDEEVTVRLVLPDSTGTLDFDGRVVHVVTEHEAHAGGPVCGFGLQFRGLTPERRKLLDQLVGQADAIVRDPSAPPPRVQGRGLTPVPGLPSGFRITLNEAERQLLTQTRAELQAMESRSDLQRLRLRSAPDEAALRRAFDDLAKRWHPGVAHRDSPPEVRALATEIFLQIEQAYRRLSKASSQSARSGARPRPSARGVPRPTSEGAPRPGHGARPPSRPSRAAGRFRVPTPQPSRYKPVPPPPAYSTDGPRPETVVGPAPTGPSPSPSSSPRTDSESIRARQRARLARRVASTTKNERLSGLKRRGETTERSPSNRQSKVDQALALISAKRYSEAAALLEQLVAQRPEARLRVLLNVVNARQAIKERDFNRARSCYQSVLVLDPNNALAERELLMLSAMGV